MKRTREFAPAKINLSLQVGAIGADGYHPLHSLVVFANVGDHLTFERASGLDLTIDGPFADGLTAGPDNLVLRAARALLANTSGQKGARIRLQKFLPLASGIGGGSADAAATLRGLNTLWQCGRSPRQLEALGLELGADVPVCVQGKPRIMRGRGEILDDVSNWPVLDAVLVNPGFMVSTKAVFARFDEMGLGSSLPKVQTFAGTHHVSDALEHLASAGNDLTPAACAQLAALSALLEGLADYPLTHRATLCGSGATCVALTASAPEAADLAQDISHAYPQYWVQAVRLAGTANYAFPEAITPAVD